MLGRCRQGEFDYVIVRQPDDTQARLPTWMTSPEAAALAVIVTVPSPSLSALLTLRRELDAVLSSVTGSPAHGGVDEVRSEVPPGRSV